VARVFHVPGCNPVSLRVPRRRRRARALARWSDRPKFCRTFRRLSRGARHQSRLSAPNVSTVASRLRSRGSTAFLWCMSGRRRRVFPFKITPLLLRYQPLATPTSVGRSGAPFKHLPKRSRKARLRSHRHRVQPSSNSRSQMSASARARLATQPPTAPAVASQSSPATPAPLFGFGRAHHTTACILGLQAVWLGGANAGNNQ